MVLRLAQDAKIPGRKFAWKTDKGLHVLAELPNNQHIDWMELVVFMNNGDSLIIGPDAAIVLAPSDQNRPGSSQVILAEFGKHSR